MKRPAFTWAAFGVCLAVGAAAMGWLGFTVVRLDRAHEDARRTAAIEENVRLALWRMDSALVPLIAQESVRPYFMYSAFYPAERAYTRMFAEIRPGEVLVPSPLLTFGSPYIQLHFQFAPDGTLTSPQVPEGNMRDLAEMGYATPETIAEASERLRALRTLVSVDTLLAALPERASPPSARPRSSEQTGGKGQAAQDMSNIAEWEAREQQIGIQKEKLPPKRASMAQRPPQAESQQVVSQAQNIQQGSSGIPQAQVPPPELIEEAFSPIWLGGELFLAREVRNDEQRYVQGCWLDWPGLRAWLLGEIHDLLPEARLEPMPRGLEPGRMPAALPVRLVAGVAPQYPREGMSPVRLSLIIAMGCILLAVIAAAALMRGVVALGERRAAFVSAVTHELRTPLTTFQLYTEMLADGMVTDEVKRQRYFRTLRREAERLAHLIANVLAYARLERVKHAGRLEDIPLGALLDRTAERLTQRAEQANLALRMENDAGVLDLTVRTDPAAVEQILFNLVDNACKYAVNASEPTIHLSSRRVGKCVQLAVRDNGPGIAKADRKRLFRPFHKSAHDAANSAPGVGLGLALSRRLASSMGGALRMDTLVRQGACFVLELPVSHASRHER